MSTNPIKAEKVLNFKDKTYKARMSLDTLMRIEEALGCSILKVGNKLSTADINTVDNLESKEKSIRAGGNDITENDVKGLVSDIGIVEGMKMTGELLTLALNVDPDNSEKKSNP